MSIIGTITGKPATHVSRALASVLPPATTVPMSALVPPTSKVMRSRRPERSPAKAPPSTPAAGPESRSVTGSSAAWAIGATPPLERMMWTSERTPAVAQPAARRRR